MALGPYLNLAKFPAGGRNWEGWGADPYLAGKIAMRNKCNFATQTTNNKPGVASYHSISGMQQQRVMACVKHMLGNEQQNNEYTESSIIDDRAVHEVFLFIVL